MSARADARPGTSPTLALLEREEDLAASAALLEHARDGRGGLLLVEGAPGVGKTALLDGAVGLAQESGFRVQRARGHELERSLPWGVVRMLLENAVLDPSDTDGELLTGPAASASVVFGSSAGRDPTSASELWFTIAHGLYRLVVRLAEPAPLLLAVDDAHWADEASLRFFIYLAARLAEHPVAVLVTARPGEHPDAGQLDVLAADSATSVRRLAGSVST